MSLDSSYVEDNARELERMRAIIERLSDDELRQPVNASWTVAGVLGHVAYWDGRALFLANKLTRGVPFTASDHDPEDVDWINDAARPLILAIPVRRAADLALEIARETDAAVARLAPDQVARTWPADPGSPLVAVRASHRAEHLDEIEESLRRR